MPKTSAPAKFLALAALVISTSANAAFLDGNDLYERLTDYKRETSRSLVSASMAFGFVVGVADTWNGQAGAKSGYMFCLPKNVKAGQLVDVVLEYLRTNPADRHYSAGSLVQASFDSAFPCR